MPRKAEDLTGMQFGNLTVIERDFTKGREPHWKCKCTCGKITYPTTSRLKSGRSKSCGCMINVKDISGRKFGKLTALYRDNDDRRKYVCLCDCGNTKSIFRNSLVRGRTVSCGCHKKEKISQTLTIDLTGQRFDRLTVIGKNISDSKYHEVCWDCMCDCGNKITVVSSSLRKGITKSCGCLRSEITSKRFSLNLIGRQFDKLTVIDRVENYVSESGSQYSQWKCLCKCGCTKIVRGHDLVRGSVSSCGCLISKGEEAIRKILHDKDIIFDTQYTFSDLKSDKGRALRFDFAIFDNHDLRCLIEYQGQQHYNENAWFGKQQREVTDDLKRRYCIDNHIKLYEISYKDNINEKIEEIIKTL